MKKLRKMQRLNEELIDPLFAATQESYSAQLQYMRGLKLAEKKRNKYLSLDFIKEGIEKTLKLVDISHPTRESPYPDARKLFVVLAVKFSAETDETAIMSRIKRDRSLYYNNLRNATDLLQTNKGFKLMYDTVIEKLLLIK